MKPTTHALQKNRAPASLEETLKRVARQPAKKRSVVSRKPVARVRVPEEVRHTPLSPASKALAAQGHTPVQVTGSIATTPAALTPAHTKSGATTALPNVAIVVQKRTRASVVQRPARALTVKRSQVKATPKELRKEFGWFTRGKGWYDNMWCINPEETVAFMQTVKKPWIAFKVLAAGAYRPQQGFKYAFESGADFIAVGMLDFQIKEDSELALKFVRDTQQRRRPWRA